MRYRWFCGLPTFGDASVVSADGSEDEFAEDFAGAVVDGSSPCLPELNQTALFIGLQDPGAPLRIVQPQAHH
jgi:hypothetical protein